MHHITSFLYFLMMRIIHFAIIFFSFFSIYLFFTCIYYYSNIKILFFVAAYGSKQLHYMYLQIKSFQQFCEYGYDIKIIIHHTDIFLNSSFNSFYCLNQAKYINLLLIKISADVKHYLPKEHRRYIANNNKEIRKYNHIGYFENDIEFSIANFKYYLYTLRLFNDLKIKNAMPGFKRYEISKCKNGDIWRSCQDHIDNIYLYNIKNTQFIRIKEGYSAMWILPYSLLKKYIYDKEFIFIPDKCHNGNGNVKEYYAYYYWEKYFTPLIPLNVIDNCFVHHLSNKYIHYYKTIQLTELYNQMNICRSGNKLLYKGKLSNDIIKINRKIIRKECFQLTKCAA